MAEPKTLKWPNACTPDILFSCFEGDKFASTYPYGAECLKEEDFNETCYNPCKDNNPFKPLSSELFNVSKQAFVEIVSVYGGSDTGNATAYNGGVIFNPQGFTVAVSNDIKKRYPPGSWIQITNPANNKRVMAQVTDMKGHQGVDATPAIYNELGIGYELYKKGKPRLEIRTAELKNAGDFKDFIRVEFKEPFEYSGTAFTNSCRKASGRWPKDVQQAMIEEWRLNGELLGKYAADFSGLVFTQLAVGADHTLKKQFIEMRIAIPEDAGLASDLLVSLHEHYKERGVSAMFGIFRETNGYNAARSNRQYSNNVPELAFEIYNSEYMDTPEGSELKKHIVPPFEFTFARFNGKNASDKAYGERTKVRNKLPPEMDPKKVNFSCNKDNTACSLTGSHTLFVSLDSYCAFIENTPPEDTTWQLIADNSHPVGEKK